ncbi:MAG: hypothetical protein KDN18_24465 [Verrucomicrobiae bacterium]|nr:hypothetical protein [Verrucomicrobiae bacterium]
MSELQIWIFVIVAGFILAKGFARPSRFFEFPYFMAATFVVFIFPQVISLKRFPGSTPLESLTPVMVMTNLCMACCYLGYLLPPSRWIAKHGSTPVKLERLFHFGALFIVVSLFFSFLISQMSAEERGGSTWSGRVTIYHFFSQLVYPGFAISLFTALSRKSSIAWIFTIVAALNPLVAILLSGRRESAALFVLTIGLTYFFHRRWIPPRPIIAAGIVFAMLAIPATSKYRSAMSQEGFGGARKIDLVGNFKRFLNEESILELRNAAVLIYTTRIRSDYDFGTAYWDQLVFRFIPAQIFGKEFKDKLMFDETEVDPEKEEAVEIGIRSFTAPKGSTLTGMGDSFKQFGYFGCLFFALLAVIFRSLWETSLQPNSFFAKLLYIQTSTSAMRAVTHQTVDFFPGLLYNVVFLGMAVFYARDIRMKRLGGRHINVGEVAPPKLAESGRVTGPPHKCSPPKKPLAPAKKRDLSELD